MPFYRQQEGQREKCFEKLDLIWKLLASCLVVGLTDLRIKVKQEFNDDRDLKQPGFVSVTYVTFLLKNANAVMSSFNQRIASLNTLSLRSVK